MSLFVAMETGLNGVQSTSGMGGRNGNVLPPTGSYMNAPLLDVHGNVVSTFAQANVDTPAGSGCMGNGMDLCTRLLDSNAETEQDRKCLLNLQNGLQLSEDELVQQQQDAQRKLDEAEKRHQDQMATLKAQMEADLQHQFTQMKADAERERQELCASLKKQQDITEKRQQKQLLVQKRQQEVLRKQREQGNSSLDGNGFLNT